MIKVNDDNTQLIFSATLQSAYKHADDDGTVKNIINVVPDDTEKVFKAVAPVFDKTGEDFTPTWFKSKEYMLLKSTFDIKVKIVEGDQITFDQFCERGLIKGANVSVKVSIKKKGVVYPMALVEKSAGEMYDPFEGMD